MSASKFLPLYNSTTNSVKNLGQQNRLENNWEHPILANIKKKRSRRSKVVAGMPRSGIPVPSTKPFSLKNRGLTDSSNYF